ncbi:DUF4265 domain-containing protein [Streptomyces yangpuensis]|uniref:DUF4265 domain-containing protein n=1 Tax=Streptomyces yangpuensis TaxID=1648182 RepID=UPI0036546515
MKVSIVHEEPVGQGRTHLAHADLAPFGLDGHVELLWLKPNGDETYSVSCIPFRTYGLALGDQVRLSINDEVRELVGRSSHRVLRMSLMPDPIPERLTERTDSIRAEIRSAGLLSEWSSDHHLAVDIPPGINAWPLLKVMHREVIMRHALTEWADMLPFSGRQ